MAKRKKKVYKTKKAYTGNKTDNTGTLTSGTDASHVDSVHTEDNKVQDAAPVQNEDNQVQDTVPVQNEVNKDIDAAPVKDEDNRENEAVKNESNQNDMTPVQDESNQDSDLTSDPDESGKEQDTGPVRENDKEADDVTNVETWIEKSEDQDEEAKQPKTDKKKRKVLIFKCLRILCTIGFFVFTGLFINEVFILPYRMNKSIEEAKSLYKGRYITNDETESYTKDVHEDAVSEPAGEDTDAGKDNANGTADDNDGPKEPTPTPDPTRDDRGRLLAFSALLGVNEDVKGWLTINNINGENDTKIDLVVMQSGPDEPDPEFYLYREWASREPLKSGSLILDVRSSVEKRTKNYVIHGHNMKSTDSMFHHLVDYKEKQFLLEHPVINFDTIYETGIWKVFSVFITPGNNERGDFFDYMRSTFKDDSDYLNFIYQLRIRSIYKIDDVDINENDQILTLSTCSYELRNYRTVVVARKVREGEDPAVNTENIKVKKNPLYPESYYKNYGGKPPELAPDFQTALENGEISWYKPPEKIPAE